MARELPEGVNKAVESLQSFVGAYAQCLWFLGADSQRTEGYFAHHLLSCLSQDFLASSFALPTLTREGMLSTARRELRFILEASVKVAFVQQEDYSLSIADKLVKFESAFDSASISIKNRVRLPFFGASSSKEFSEEVGRLYGRTSQYVHLSVAQIKERIQAVESGRYVGSVTVAEVEDIADLSVRVLAASLVYLFDAVPSWVAGDFFVQSDGTSFDWPFSASRWIARIDESFDYKAERNDILEQVRATRDQKLRF